MESYFLINPVSGNGRAMSFLPDIEDAISGMKKCHLHTTSHKGGASAFVRKIAESGRPCRFFALGGDGTLNEVINGIHGLKNAQAGFIPAGTGNDFVRCFNGIKHFTNIADQLDGTPMEIDTVKVTLDDNEPIRFINMMNIGFDCNVVINASHMRGSGSTAYIKGVFKELFSKNWGFNLKAFFDDGSVYNASALLFTLANGRYCGGGFLSSPYAELDNGLIDAAVVDRIGRLKIISLLKAYRDGTYLKQPKVQEFITYKRCSKIVLEVKGKQGVSLDGEIFHFKKAELLAENKTIEFIVPRGAEYKRAKNA
ncbi:MAG: diacylglycerol kinase family protein [Candidatus Metalachnospira sp.]|nr:diacylglycerol kinase family protein [Candidatus Metalachnospira sp.]